MTDGGPCVRSLWRIIADAGRQMLPQEEVRVEGRRFSVARQLGEGGFSFVYLVREIPDTRGEEFALKRVLLHEAGTAPVDAIRRRGRRPGGAKAPDISTHHQT